MRRTFEKAGVRVGDSIKSGYRISCAACRRESAFAANTRSGHFPEEVVRRRFTQDGWVVGSHPKQDRCPECQKGASLRKPAQVDPELAEIAETLNADLRLRADDLALHAEAPPDMTRADKRIIFAKLEEIYIDEKRGYDRGWSDQRLAEDLGVPRAWIALEENFGPAFDLAAVESLERAHRALQMVIGEAERASQAAADEVTELMKTFRREADALEARLRAAAAPLQAAIDSLDARTGEARAAAARLQALQGAA